MYGPGWENFSTQPTMVGLKKSTQPNPHGLGWTHRLVIFLITIINIKSTIRTTPPQIMQIYNKIILSTTSNQHKLYKENLRFGFYLERVAKSK